MDKANADNNKDEFPLLAVSLSLGGIILGMIIMSVICLAFKRKKETVVEELDVDENHVYGVYQLGEAYERHYSTNEAIDNNFYYK